MSSGVINFREMKLGGYSWRFAKSISGAWYTIHIYKFIILIVYIHTCIHDDTYIHTYRYVDI